VVTIPNPGRETGWGFVFGRVGRVYWLVASPEMATLSVLTWVVHAHPREADEGRIPLSTFSGVLLQLTAGGNPGA